MKYENAVREFKTIYLHLYLKKVDYWTAEEAWAGYKDRLCKNGEITQKQYEIWQTPFPYGKNLKPNKRQLQIAADGCGMW